MSTRIIRGQPSRSTLLLASVGLLGLVGTSNAALVSVSQGLFGNSTLGTAAAIIPAPSDALDDLVTNTGMQGFDEARGVTTTVAHGIDSGTIAAGTVVDSHMIFLNSQGSQFLEHDDVTWTFDGMVIGVMSDGMGNLEANSTFELGAAGTNYTTGPGAPPFSARGLEGGDSYTVAGNTITVDMRVTEPGDWIRVVTVSAVPLPAAAWMFISALGVFGYLGKKRRAALA